MKKIIFLCAILSLGMASNANAVLLGEGYLGKNAVNVPTNALSIDAILKFADSYFSDDPVVFGETISLIDGDDADDDIDAVGRVYTYSDPDDDNFKGAAGLLTDTMGGYLWGLPSDSIYGQGINESNLVSGSSYSSNGTDFAGHDITRIEWVIDDLYKSNPLNPLDGFDQYFLGTTVKVYGVSNVSESGESNTVPIPSSLVLLSIGFVGIGFGRHKKRRA